MTVNISEYDAGFSINFIAESLDEAAKLVRLGMNSTKELRSLSTYATQTGNISSAVFIGKAVRSSSEVPHVTRTS